MKHVLFICSQNKLRSPTAERIFSDAMGFSVQSAGLNKDAHISLNVEMVEEADYIFVMEKSHRNKLRRKFKPHINRQRIICLDIPDEYNYMDPLLIKILKERLNSFFGINEDKSQL